MLIWYLAAIYNIKWFSISESCSHLEIGLFDITYLCFIKIDFYSVTTCLFRFALCLILSASIYSNIIGPRHPFFKDPYLDYEIDSDEEWEEVCWLSFVQECTPS